MNDNGLPLDDIAELKRRLNMNPADVEAAVALGNIYYDCNQPAQSVIYYTLALSLDPALPGVRTDLGTMYWRNDDVALAEQAFRQVVRDFPDYGAARLNLGLLLLHAKGEPQQARAVWQDLIDRHPSYPEAVKARGLLARTMN